MSIRYFPHIMLRNNNNNNNDNNTEFAKIGDMCNPPHCWESGVVVYKMK